MISDKQTFDEKHNQHQRYEIRLKGHLDDRWTEWFESLTVSLEEDGNTLLTGLVVDQAALHGLLKKIRDLGLPLVSVNQVQFNETHPYRSKKEIKMNTHRKIGVLVGVFFLAATITYMTGSGLIRSFFVDENPNKISLVIGVLLEIADGAAVVGIGVLMFPILKMFNKRLALGYVIFRVIECAIIIAAGIYMSSLLKPMWKYEMIIFLFTGLGGLIFSDLLYQSNLIPRLLSVLGLIGYALLSIGVLLDLLGYFSMNTNAGMLFYIPGGLFELFLPIWLFIKGFNSSAITSESAKANNY